MVVLVVGSGCSRAPDSGAVPPTETTPATSAAVALTTTPPAACTETVGTNLLINPSFEEGTALGTGWIDESSTVGQPTYTLSTNLGVSDGAKAQRMQYSGGAGDDGAKKAEFYQGPVEEISPGQTLQFSVCVSGPGTAALTKAYAIIGIEAFRADKTYIADVSTNITAVTTTPTRYSRDFTVPEGASFVSVFVQAPEFTADSAIDLYFDEASLVVE